MTPSFRDLFLWEWRHAGRAPLLWAILAILSVSFVWGALSTASLHRAQTAAMERARAAEATWQADAAALARTFRAPVTEGAGLVAYWQDPTNVAGYSEYYVRDQALKPHRPASPLAAGVSDVAPSRLEIKLNTLFGFPDTYDFENPRGLALGRFDVAFVIVYLTPVALMLLFALLGTVERDRGMLRLVASQSTGPTAWVGARMLAILAWAAPAVILALLVSLALAGVPPQAAGTVAVAAVLLLAYMLFWSALAFVVLLRQPGAASALGSLAAIWAGLTIGLPLVASAVIAVADPAPSPLRYIDSRRRVSDAVEQDRTAILEQAVAQRADLRGAVQRPIDKLDYATRLSFLIPETERRLAPLQGELASHRARQERLAAMAGYAAPTLGVELALASLAGTDAARQRAFETQARDHQLRLRGIVYPLVQKEMLQPPPPAERATRGRLNLLQPLTLPPFVFQEPAAANRTAGALGFSLWLGALTVVVTFMALRGARAWRVS